MSLLNTFPYTRVKTSVIIPTLNEERLVEGTLLRLGEEGLSEDIIVVDGGSMDDTRAIARRYANTIQTPPSRARQMNAGAAAASGDLLLFLHADSRPGRGYGNAVRTMFSDDSVEACCAPIKFDHDHPLLTLYGKLSRLPIIAAHYGDGGLVIRRHTFERLGGFREIPMLEDVDILRRLRGRVRLLPVPVVTSARRFLAGGIVLTQLRNAMILVRYYAGVDPARLAPLYPPLRN